jgi:hypothetical protein
MCCGCYSQQLLLWFGIGVLSHNISWTRRLPPLDLMLLSYLMHINHMGKGYSEQHYGSSLPSIFLKRSKNA